MEEMEEGRGPLSLDWAVLNSSINEDEESTVLVVATTVDDEQPQNRAHSPVNSDPESSKPSYRRDQIECMSDRQLDETISRKRSSLDALSTKLPDNGDKLRRIIRCAEDEKERRRLRRLKPDANGCQMPMQSTRSGAVGDFMEDASPSNANMKSLFASHFCRKTVKNDTACTDVNAFDDDFSYLGHCANQKTRQSGEFSPRKSHRKQQLSSRKYTSKCPRRLSLGSSVPTSINVDQNCRSSSFSPHSRSTKSLKSCLSRRRNAFHDVSSSSSLYHTVQTVNLVDEEESQPLETTSQAERLPECMKDARVYYPSRDDAEAVEICYTDLKCLDPEAYLSSSIMNFYVRYLQQLASPTDRARHGYHFFNTYFYNKLKEAESRKNMEFSKFRRWWKGVNIFQKAYILIPIHEYQHWSLVIICIPDIEEESGPILLHLDSLGLHCSKSIFSNIKSFLSNEWRYLKAAPPDVPIADSIWKCLPRKIRARSPSVPQQRNDFDCGLFVLFFMERFMDNAPERWKIINFAMFSKEWFKPEDASRLRRKIDDLLIQEFERADEQRSPPAESLPSSPVG